MAIIVVSSWIPRSYTHIYEIGEKLEGIDLPIKDIRIDDSLYFTITTKKGREVKVEQTPYGLFSFITEDKGEVSAETISGYKDEVRHLLIEDVFKAIQHVTYQQIKDGILPLSFHASVFNGECRPEGLTCIEESDLKVFYNNRGLYSADSDIYVCGKSEGNLTTVTGYFSYIVLTSSYMNFMVEEMSRIYKEVMEVEETIGTAEFDAIKNVMVSIGTIRKDCSERYGKLIQATANIAHTLEAYSSEELSSKQEKLSDMLKIKKGFNRLEKDTKYLMPLWNDVLIKNLENLDFMVEARFELQQSLETRKEEKEMKLLQGIFLIGVIASIFTLGAMPGATITLYDTSGNTIATGDLISFKISDFISFGLSAVAVSLILFFLFNYMYMKAIRKTEEIKL